MSYVKEISKPEISIDPQLIHDMEEEGQVVVHCSFYNDPNMYEGEVGVRVWQNTFLIDEQNGIMLKMIKAFGIVYQPAWCYIKSGEVKRFTMIFDKLPKSCKSFTLAEIINQPGPFIVKGIKRNKTDIYNVRLD